MLYTPRMKASTGLDYQERVVRTLVYIQEPLDDNLDLERAAAVAAFSAFISTASFADSSAKR